MTLETETAPRRFEWAICDEVIRLRRWASARVHELPRRRAEAGADCTIGSSKACTIRLAEAWVSRRHAQLSRQAATWRIKDLGSKNGLYVDGLRLSSTALAPGMKIDIGGVPLVAESPRLIDLYCFLGRVLGWGDAHREAVDVALQEIRRAQRANQPIGLQGEGDLVPVAQDLHRHLFSPAAPFVVFAAHRESAAIPARGALEIDQAGEALSAARGGSLCVRRERLPELLRGMPQARETLESAQLFVCDEASSPEASGLPDVTRIQIPRLVERGPEQLAHIVFEYAADAALSLGAPRPLGPEDLAWIRQHSATSLGEIAKGAPRLLALRMEGSTAGAARRLKMASVSLRRWFQRRALPPRLSPDETAAIGATDSEVDV